MDDICGLLAGRSDKRFLGSGNLAIQVGRQRVRVLFVQKWWEDGVFDFAAGEVEEWAPDRIRLSPDIPADVLTASETPTARYVFITRDDVMGVYLEWNNSGADSKAVSVDLPCEPPGTPSVSERDGFVFLNAQEPYRDYLPLPVYFTWTVLGNGSDKIESATPESVSRQWTLSPGETASLTLLLGIGIDRVKCEQAVQRWCGAPDILRCVREDWNEWFHQHVPRFYCSDRYFQILYYYRWWSLYTKMILARVGHFLFPCPREGTLGFNAVISYSGACVSVDELRWLRDPSWAFSTVREFFASENLYDGYLAHHIWDWGINREPAMMDRSGRSVPYHNYAVAAFYGALLVHPNSGLETLQAVWPQMKTHLESYSRVFDIDRDNLYETYPYSVASGMEWGARYLYFHSIPELFRLVYGRFDEIGQTSDREILDLLEKIKSSVVTDPEAAWPETGAEVRSLLDRNYDHRLATVDQSSYAYRDFSAAACLAELLGDHEAETHFRGLAEKVRDGIQSTMWDSEDAFFYDVQTHSRRHARVKSPTGYYPFWARICEPQHVPALKPLFDPRCFWVEYPVPSLPLNYPSRAKLRMEGWDYWNYWTWPRSTCHVVDGVLWAAKGLNPELREKAADLFRKYTLMHFRDLDPARPTIAERYDPHSGAPVLDWLDYNHSSWIDLLFLHAVGITPQASPDLVIDPVDMGWEEFSVRGLRYRGWEIDVLFDRTTGMIVKANGRTAVRSDILERVQVPLEGTE